MLKLSDVLEAQARYRATLPKMVDRETVIELIFQAVDETIQAFEKATKTLPALAEKIETLSASIKEMSAPQKGRKP